jgi:hypothetical protein
MGGERGSAESRGHGPPEPQLARSTQRSQSSKTVRAASEVEREARSNSKAGRRREAGLGRCLKQCRQQDRRPVPGQGRQGGRGRAHGGAWWQAGPALVEQGRAGRAQASRGPARQGLVRCLKQCRQQDQTVVLGQGQSGGRLRALALLRTPPTVALSSKAFPRS